MPDLKVAMGWATESLRWYTKTGEPVGTVTAQNGAQRTPTLRDARKHGWLPSVTTIIRQAAAPGLERWKAEQVLLAALTLRRDPGEPEKDYIARVWQDSREQARHAAERGTEIHAGIEKHFRGEPVPGHLNRYVNGVVMALAPLNLTEIRTERSFASKHGFGGKTDLVAETEDGPVVIDFKGKDGDLTDVKLYDEHLMQLAGYEHGLKMEGARLGIVFVSRTHPGTALLKMVEPEDAKRGWSMFLALLMYWQAANDYIPQRAA